MFSLKERLKILTFYVKLIEDRKKTLNDLTSKLSRDNLTLI